MDPEQSDLGPHCLPSRLLKHFSRREKQTTFVAIGALRVNILVSGMYFQAAELVEHNDSAGRELDWGIEGLLV